MYMCGYKVICMYIVCVVMYICYIVIYVYIVCVVVYIYRERVAHMSIYSHRGGEREYKKIFPPGPKRDYRL